MAPNRLGRMAGDCATGADPCPVEFKSYAPAIAE